MSSTTTTTTTTTAAAAAAVVVTIATAAKTATTAGLRLLSQSAFVFSGLISMTLYATACSVDFSVPTKATHSD